jgi:hypothetical protein
MASLTCTETYLQKLPIAPLSSSRPLGGLFFMVAKNMEHEEVKNENAASEHTYNDVTAQKPMLIFIYGLSSRLICMAGQ